MKEIVINTCFGGFSLSHEGIMEYAKLKGITLHPFVEARDEDGSINFHKFVPYVGGKHFIVHYSKSPLRQDGTYEENSYFSTYDIPRDDPDLIKVVKELKEKANGNYAELSIVEIPDDVDWEIDEYDGNESVAEKHRSWR